MERLYLRIGGVGLFAFYGRDHSYCGVQPALVVRAVDPRGDVLSDLLACVPSAPIDESAEQGGEGRLGWHVVQCLATFVSVVLNNHTRRAK